jgi:hypothetical protein
MPVVGHVQQEIAPHDAHADHADFILLLWLRICHSFAFRSVILHLRSVFIARQARRRRWAFL